MTIIFRPTGPEDVAEIRHFWREHWGDDFMVAHGAIYRPESLLGFIAEDDQHWVGLVTYQLLENECEIVSLDSLRAGMGIGSRLIDRVTVEAVRTGCKRVYLITTNDNLEALGFYQKRGFELAGVGRGAVDRSRKIKPAIPLIGLHDIPLRDEIELEMRL